MKKSKNRTFDAVRTMRDIRDAVNRETAGMNYEDQKRYIRERVRPRARKDG